MTSLEEVITTMVSHGLLKDAVVSALWGLLADKKLSGSRFALGALTIISFVANAKPTTVQENIDKLLSITLSPSITTADGLCLAKSACVALQKLKNLGVVLSPEHPLFAKLLAVVEAQYTGSNRKGRQAFDAQWFAASEQSLNTVYALCVHPEALCTKLVQSMATSARLFGANSADQQSTRISKRGLSRLLFIVGHAAVKQLVFIEETASRLKKGTDANRLAAAEEAQSQKNGKKGNKQKKSDEPGSPRGLEAELGISAAIEEGEAEIIREIAEQEILAGTNLLGTFAHTVSSICTLAYTSHGSAGGCPATEVDEGVREVAVLALCKLMTVGAKYCEDNLQLLFTVLAKDKSPRVRANIIIALGDLAFRFPNQLEPWSAHFYAMLGDTDLTVRKHTLMALTHLILNDMIKVRAQVAEIAMCLEDTSSRMQELARLFFSELSHKGTSNPIYNYLPDIIGRLSHNGKIDPEAFQRIVKFLISFIEKDKQAEGLIEKLCHRFRGTAERSQWRDIAFCLSLLNYSDRCIKKISELFKCYADKLWDEKVNEAFGVIVAKGRKFAKPETKLLLDEYEAKLLEAHTKAAIDQAAVEKAERAARAGAPSPTKQPVNETMTATSADAASEATDIASTEPTEQNITTENAEDGTLSKGTSLDDSKKIDSEEQLVDEGFAAEVADGQDEDEQEVLDVAALKVAELKEELQRLGLDTSGKKAVLAKRLTEALSADSLPETKTLTKTKAPPAAKQSTNAATRSTRRTRGALTQVN
eukprot:SAG31_NODE_308_length_17951_cov_4.779240_16_plen_762_part_00